MSKLNLDRDKVQACRDLAKKITQRVYRDLEGVTTSSIERASLRFIGLEDALAGKPVVNAILEAIPKELQGKGALYWFGRALACQRTSPISLALRIAGGKVQLTKTPEVPKEEIAKSLGPFVQRGLERIGSARRKKEQTVRWPDCSKPMKYVEVGTGDVDQDVEQALAAAKNGADCVAIHRLPGQSLIDYIPSGETNQGQDGTSLTQANLRKLRRALDRISQEIGHSVRLAHSAAGLCMPEIALIASSERLDYLLCDALYGVIFRDINVKRAFADQFFARLILAHSGVSINTGENYYAAHQESYRVFPQVLSSHFLNEQFSFLSHLSEWQMGFSHAFEIDPEMEDGLLYELAQAQVVQECFPKASIKYLPPTRHKTDDISCSHLMDGLFALVGVMTHQDIQQLSMGLKGAHYVLKNARSLGDEIQWLANGKVVRRARSVLDGAYRFLQKIDKAGGLFRALSSGYLSGMTRHIDQGAGMDGLIVRDSDYFNPVLEALLKAKVDEKEEVRPSMRHRSTRRSSEVQRRGRRSSEARSSRSDRRDRQRPRRERPLKPEQAQKEPPKKEVPKEPLKEVSKDKVTKDAIEKVAETMIEKANGEVIEEVNGEFANLDIAGTVEELDLEARASDVSDSEVSNDDEKNRTN